MSEIVKSKIDEIAPSKILENSMMMEVESWVTHYWINLRTAARNKSEGGNENVIC